MAAKLTYGEQLRHPNWQRKRLEVMQLAHFACESCGDTDTTLNVHHKRYVKGRMAWEYENNELSVLCEDCHATDHSEREVLDRLIVYGGPDAIQTIIGLASGYLCGRGELDFEFCKECYDGREPFFELGVAASTIKWGRPCRDLVREKAIAGNANTNILRVLSELWDFKEI